MEKNKDKIEVEGKVVEALKEELTLSWNQKMAIKIKAYTSGKMRMNMIRILVGDTVTVAISPYDLKNGIIIWNKRQEEKL